MDINSLVMYPATWTIPDGNIQEFTTLCFYYLLCKIIIPPNYIGKIIVSFTLNMYVLLLYLNNKKDIKVITVSGSLKT